MPILSRYIPEHSQNRMRHEGDLESARSDFLNGHNINLEVLLENRFSWMNSYLDSKMMGIEVGSGIGASQKYIKCKELLLTDINDNEWLDLKNVDALNLPFGDSSLDFVIASNILHHVAKPHIFMEEITRVLKPGGFLFLMEAHTSLFSKIVMRVMRHEGWDDTVDVFNHDVICNNPSDPWSANCSIPKLMFSSKSRFEKEFANLSIVHSKYVEFLSFLNSGGVTAKFFYIPFNRKINKAIAKFDSFLSEKWPSVFALGRQIVVRKTNNEE